MFRIGLGHDTHRLIEGPPLIIGGIHVPHHAGPDAHSDGDVLLHALTDALLGALALGDIGELFPNDEPAHAARNSSVFVQRAMSELKERGWRPVNVDSTIFAQRPKLYAYKRAIAERIAELLELPQHAVNVKAKTGERVGPIGRQEAIGADVVVLIERMERPH
jgi:2-C-methyl-D-erythritol 2,4-cyclodiphosphate synthase